MGLDVSAYTKLREVDPPDGQRDLFTGITQDELDETEKCFPGRSEGVKAGIYAHGGELHFRAGSYTGYGEWRDWLTKWATKHWHKNGKETPFAELIEFFDNEGIIGPVVAAKLADDFAKYCGEARQYAGEEFWDFSLYCRFWCACMLAADQGAILFH